MRRALVASFVLLATTISFSLVNVSPVSACSCVLGPNPPQANDVAFTGTISDIEQLDDPTFAMWTIETEDVYVGDVGETIQVKANVGSSASCGTYGNVGDQVALAPFIRDGELSVHLCTPLSRLVVGDPYPPTVATVSDPPINYRNVFYRMLPVVGMLGWVIYLRLRIRRKRNESATLIE